MSYHYIKILVYILSISYCTSAGAQHLQRPIRHLSTKDGLPQSFVSGLAQDNEGFVWIATRNGLAVYDGIKFKTFRHSNTDSSSIASNLLIKIVKAADGAIWIEHELGEIDRLDPQTNQIEHITKRKLFRQQPVKLLRRSWLTDSEGNLWCHQNNNELIKYNWKKDIAERYLISKEKNSVDSIRGYMEDSKKQVWVLTNKSLKKIDNKGQITSIALPFTTVFKSFQGVEPVFVQMIERRNGDILFSDARLLVLYNPAKGEFTTSALPSDASTGIRWMQKAPDGYEYFDIWGTVYRYKGPQNIEAVADIGPVPVRDVQSFMVDFSGLLWMGVNAGGIYQIDLSAPFFETHTNDLTFHSDLLKLELGVSLSNFAQWPTTEKKFKSSSYYFRSAYDAEKKLWIALGNQVGYYHQKEKQIIKLPAVPIPSGGKNISLDIIRGIDFSPEGGLWATTNNNGYTAYYDATAKNWVTFIDTNFLKDYKLLDGVSNMVIDADNIWLSSINGAGLLRVDRKTKTVRQFTTKSAAGILPTNQLIGLLKDPAQKDILWIGSYEGVVYFNKRTLQTTFYSIKEGLPDNTAYSIQFDDNGYLWISTNKGLCRFDTATHTLNIFQMEDGLPGDEFNRFHHFKLPNGKMAFGGTDGWVLFNPLTMKTDTYLPQVAFTGLKVNNIDVDAESSEIKLEKNLDALEQISLKYNQNTLVFSFAGLEFTQPKKIQYRYKLEGYDKDWIITSNPEAVYTKLPPGDYTLEVDATNTTGVWSDKKKRLPIKVSPPAWRTWWAYTLYFFIGIGWIALFIRYRINRERLKQEVALKEKEAAQLKKIDELKGRFFANITHDFRTPLTLILGPVQQLKASISKASDIRWLESIERNAVQMLQLINQLLDLSKLEAGSLQLDETTGSPIKLVEDMVQSFKAEAESKKITLHFNYSGQATGYRFDAGKLQQVAGNLIANAVKFTPAGGSIEVFVQAGNEVSLTVSDTGIGIAPEKLPFIFNRFYQADSGAHNMASVPGSGIGLALVKELVELQKGTIKAASNNGHTGKWNTVFSVSFPFSKASENQEADANPLPQQVVLKSYHANEAVTNLEEDTNDETTILLVEDNMELAEFIIDSLGHRYHIISMPDGKQGFSKAVDVIPDLVISDIMMPVMNGYDLCDAIKKDERTSHIPVILLTAKATFNDRIEGLTLGADDYLTKPFHVKELLLRIHNLTERQKRFREKIQREFSQPGLHEPMPTPAVPTQEELFLQKFCLLVEDNLDKTNFGVEEIAREVGMSRANLHRKLKAIAGLPAGEIIRNYRLKRAAEFLRQGHNSSETAYMAGFDSPAYFSKCFKDFYQLTPTEFSQKNSK